MKNEIPTPSDFATEINQKADAIVSILQGQKLDRVKIILGRVEDKLGELFLLKKERG